jgi:hypothetical protein
MKSKSHLRDKNKSLGKAYILNPDKIQVQSIEQKR